jgi:cytoskeletal protein CcmA (bactofilin family)
MKRLLLTLAMIIGLGTVSSLAWINISHAADVRSGDAPSVGKSETVEGSVYIAGRDVTVSGTIKGDVFCAGVNIFVTGKVEGDVICAGQIVRITGTVTGDVRLAGQQVDLGADVQGSATVAAQSFDFLPDAKIGRDLTVWGENARIDGTVGRDVLGGGSQVLMSAAVGRNVQLDTDNLALEQKAKIAGDLSYQSTSQATVEDGATVSGSTHFTPRPANKQRYDGPALALWSTLYGLGSLLLIGLAAIAIAPRWFDALGAAVRNRPVASFGFGAVGLLATPIVVVLLMVTVVGIPLGLMLLLTWIAALVASFAITSYAVGWWTVEKIDWPPRGRRIASLVIGLILVGMLGLIPVIGALVRIASLLFGLGAIGVVLIKRLRPSKNKATKGAKA